MYQVIIENVERFLSYKVRLKICDNADADEKDDVDAKGIIYPDFFFEEQTS